MRRPKSHCQYSHTEPVYEQIQEIRNETKVIDGVETVVQRTVVRNGPQIAWRDVRGDGSTISTRPYITPAANPAKEQRHAAA